MEIPKNKAGLYVPPPGHMDCGAELNYNWDFIGDFMGSTMAQQETFVTGKWKVYTDDELKPSSDDTWETIINRMADQTKANIYIGGSETPSALVPDGQTIGLLVIKKYSKTRCYAYFQHATSVDRWRGVYNDAYNPKWRGWNKIPTVDTSLTWNTAEAQNNFASDIKYAKDNAGNVYVNGLFRRSTIPLSQEVICILPVSYRPMKQWSIQINMDYGTSGNSYSTIGAITTGGNVRFDAVPSVNFRSDAWFAIDTVFKAVA